MIPRCLGLSFSGPVRALVALACLALAASRAGAEEPVAALRIEAGAHARAECLVRALVDLPAGFDDLAIAELPAGPLLVQLSEPGLLDEPDSPGAGGRRTVEAAFWLPRLEAGAAATGKLRPATAAETAAARAGSFQWSPAKEGALELRRGDAPVATYQHASLDDSSPARREQTFKVFHHLSDPAGQRLVTKGPGGLYTHHRGLFYGFNRITYGEGRKADVWHARDDAYQSHEETLSQVAGPVQARSVVRIAWHGEGKQVFANEQRELAFYDSRAGRLIEFRSRLTPVQPPVKLDGDPQHAGFHFRAAQEVAEKTKDQTYFLRPDGQGKPGETRNWPDDPQHVNLPWNAMSFVLGNQRYTVAYLDHPRNPKEARFSERDYGRFGSYFEHDLGQSDTLDVRYRVWLQAGEMTGKQIAQLARDFTEPPRVTVVVP